MFESLKQATAPDPPQEPVYAELIALLAARDQLVIARDFLAEMRQVGHAPSRSLYHALINGYARSSLPNGLQEAETLFEDMKAAGLNPTEVSCACLMQVYRTYGALPQAKRLYEYTREKALLPSPLLLDAFLCLACEQKAYDDAEQVFQHVQSLTPPPSLLNSTWVALSFMYKERGGDEFRSFAKKHASLLRRRAVLAAHHLLNAEISALASGQ